MKNEILPTEELKKFGIINEDNTFSKKLTPDDVLKFMQGYTIVADNEKNRATFQLVENNTKLKVIFLERDKSLSEILENSKDKIEYSDIKNVSGKMEAKLSIEKKAFVFDKETDSVREFDLIKNAPELTKIIAERKNAEESNRYQTELLKLKGFLQDKIDQFPEMAKEITNDLNIVSKEINTINGNSQNEINSQKKDKTDIQLNVNDPDVYQEANEIREENERKEEEEQERPRGLRR